MKRSPFIFLVVAITFSLFFPRSIYAQADAGPDTAICKGNKILIGTPPYSETWCYTWEPDNQTLSDRKAPQPEASPEVTTIYKLTVVGPDFTFTDYDEMTLKVLEPKVEFMEYPKQKYGFDNYGDNSAIPWKSVMTGESDSVIAKITPVSTYNHLFFKSTNAGSVTVSPGNAVLANQDLVVTGNSYGTTDLQANGDEEDGININTMKVKSYNGRSHSVAIILIAEENDDEQYIPVGEGSPYETAITAGPGGTLESINEGDDEIVGNTISTGLNGKCESTAIGNDVQVINLNNGKPNTICISIGLNGEWDTGTPGGDDYKDGNDLRTGSDGICNTLARDSTFVSTDVDEDQVREYINKVYAQAATEWTVVRLPRCTCNYDLDGNDSIDVKNVWMTPEMAVIRDKCGNSAYDKNIFLVDKPNDNSVGFMDYYQRYGYIHADNAPKPPYNMSPGLAIAHELGHSLGLPHTFERNVDPWPPLLVQDPGNLMHPVPTGWKLRKNQWDIINP